MILVATAPDSFSPVSEDHVNNQKCQNNNEKQLKIAKLHHLIIVFIPSGLPR